MTAFLWFGFAAFAGSLFFSFLGMRSGLSPSTGGIRRGKDCTSSQDLDLNAATPACDRLHEWLQLEKMRTRADSVYRTRQGIKAMPSAKYATYECLKSLPAWSHIISLTHVTLCHAPGPDTCSNNGHHFLGMLLDWNLRVNRVSCLISTWN